MIVSQALAQSVHTDPASGNRYLYLHAMPAEIAEVTVCKLPPGVISYIYPCSDCQSDLLTQLFGGARSRAPILRAVAIEDLASGLILRYLTNQELSTDGIRESALS